MKFLKQLLFVGVVLLFSNNLAFAESPGSDEKAVATSAEHTSSGVQSKVQTPPETEDKTEKVLVTFNALPPAGDYEVIGPINVYKRWFGGIGTAMRMLGEKARELGANAVVESRVWLAPAFPAQVAPHGSGIAVRIKDPNILRSLADSSSTWE